MPGDPVIAVSSGPEEELHLLILDQQRDGAEPVRWLRAGLGSALAHLVLVPLFGWLLLSGPPPRAAAPEVVDLRRVVKLTAPILPKKIAEPTQTAPNKGRPAPEVTAESLKPRPFEPPRQARTATPPPGAPALPDPPVIETPKPEAPRPAQSVPPAGTVPPPQTPPAEKPKLAFETPGSQFGNQNSTNPRVRLQPPKPAIEEAIRNPQRPGAGGVAVGDTTEESGNPMAPPSSQKSTASSLELMSDPQGVDFRPYLTQVLVIVRRNWMAVIPESARIGGRRGRVLIQFIVDRQGGVPKLVIAMPSGTEALDRAAVAGISASLPLPPLPAGFKGDQVRLQLAFTYNLSK